MTTGSQELQSDKRQFFTAVLKTVSSAFKMVDHCDVDSMYSLEEMLSTNDDYIQIKKCFDNTMLNGDGAEISKIYRVTKKPSLREQKSNHLLLFHGTTRINAIGILKEGFKASTQGIHGPGVYMTASSTCAVRFSFQTILKNDHQGWNDRLYFIFANEVLKSDMLKEKVDEKKNTIINDTPREHDFEKVRQKRDYYEGF